jgi:hypothetical protein
MTRKHYIDGAVVRNNPVRIADEERRLIWKSGNNSADIILSIGTGILTKSSGETKSAPNSARKVLLKTIPKGIREKITIGYDMVTSTLDCEREWQEFLSSIRDDSSFVSICHRVNVGLEIKPPKIDDISEMRPLMDNTDYYFSGTTDRAYFNPKYRIGKDHIKAVARRLVASLFYFEPLSLRRHLSFPPQSQLERVSGFLRCRLGPRMARQFASLASSRPEFRIAREDGSHTMMSRLQFDPVTYSSPVVEFTARRNSWVIEVRFRSSSREWEKISGHS